MSAAFTNLPLRFIETHPAYLDLFLTRRLHPELGLDALALDTLSRSWHREKASIFHDAGLTCAIHLPFFDLHPGSLDPLAREACTERLKQAINVAKIYRPSHFVAHLDYNPLTYANFQDEWLENSLNTWGMLLEHAGDTPLFLENVFEPSPRPQALVLGALEGRIRACLDLGHWHSFAGGAVKKNLQEWLQELDPFLGHLHLHDNDGSGDQHLGLGQGSIVWAELWEYLERRTTSVGITFEPHTEADFLATQNYLLAHTDILPLCAVRTPAA